MFLEVVQLDEPKAPYGQKRTSTSGRYRPIADLRQELNIATSCLYLNAVPHDEFSKVDGLGFVVDFFDFGARPLHGCWLQKSGAQHPGLGWGFECVIQGTVKNYFNCLVDFILFHKALGVILRDQSGSIKDAFLF